MTLNQALACEMAVRGIIMMNGWMDEGFVQQEMMVYVG